LTGLHLSDWIQPEKTNPLNVTGACVIVTKDTCINVLATASVFSPWQRGYLQIRDGCPYPLWSFRILRKQS
jgi:hypothetical protein